MKQKTLRVTLIFVALTGLFALPVLGLPWVSAVEGYRWFGIDMPKQIDSSYLEYLTYLGAALSVVVGCLYLMAGIWPQRYRNIIPFLGFALIFIGVVVLYHGIRLNLPAWPFYPDPIISFVCGTTILILRKHTGADFRQGR